MNATFSEGGFDNMNPMKGKGTKALLDKIHKLERELKKAKAKGKWDEADRISEKIRILRIESDTE